MSEPAAPTARYWRQTQRVSALLLLLWLVLTLGIGLFGQSLDFDFFGWPFGFWATSQGALIVYCLIVWVYAWAMDRIEAAQVDRQQD
jgi:putative solute:sodium symporter small subunit